MWFSDWLNLNRWWDEGSTTDRSLSASCLRSTNSGRESLNSFIFSSSSFPTVRFLTSFGSFLNAFRNPSMPSWRTLTLRFAHRFSAHCSLAFCIYKQFIYTDWTKATLQSGLQLYRHVCTWVNVCFGVYTGFKVWHFIPCFLDLEIIWQTEAYKLTDNGT